MLNSVKMAGIVLVVAGILALVYGGFTYNKETHKAVIGQFELSIEKKETVNIPVWAGIAAIAIGGALFLFGGKKN